MWRPIDVPGYTMWEAVRSMLGSAGGGGRNSEIYIYFRSHAPCAEKMLDDVVVRFGYPDVTGGKRYVAPGLVESSIQLENGRAEQ